MRQLLDRSRRRRQRRVATPLLLVTTAVLLTAWGMLRAQPRPRRAAARPKKTTATAASAKTKPTFPAAPKGARVTQDGWFAPPKRQNPLPPLPEKVTKVFIIPIREDILTKTFESMKRKVMWAKAKGAELIIFDMDTPGGLVSAAENIAHMMKTDLNDTYTVCMVRPNAYSAGALIALACDEIVMTSVSAIGDCAPISLGGGELSKITREKSESPIRTIFRNSARRNGYNLALSQSMVSAQLEVWMVRHIKTRELRYVLRENFKGKVRVPPAISTAPTNPKGEWEVLEVAVKRGELLTMDVSETLKYGFVTRQVSTTVPQGQAWYGELMKEYNVVGRPTVLEDTWSEKLVEFLTSFGVRSFLMMIAILAIYAELNSPGVGLPGMVAVIALTIVFGSGYIVGLAAWWEIALFVVGLILLGIEIFVTPGFGVLGIIGILCSALALLAMVVPNAPSELPIPDTEMAWDLFKTGAASIMVGVFGAFAGAILLARYLPKVPVANRLILTPSGAKPMPATEHSPLAGVDVGDTGTVHSVCRPVGQVRFGEVLADAMAEGEMIPVGAKVRVVKKEGNRVVVVLDA